MSKNNFSHNKTYRQKWQSRPAVEGVTIDAEHSKDLDDAIHIERRGSEWLIQVSIADVGVGVPIGSKEDMRAMRRVFTRYYGTSNKPMLPRILSEDQYSLWEGKERPVLVISIRLSDQLEVLNTEIKQRRLTSQKKLSYEGVDTILKEGDQPFYALLNQCKAIALALLESRRKRGALAIYDLNYGWRTTEEGELVKLLPEQQHVANIIVQEFMILANGAVAEYAAQKNIPILFRNHTAQAVAPERDRLMQDIQNAIADPVRFSLETVRKKMYVVLNRATYGPYLEGHYGLNLPFYTHFTSPIRRLADLVNHRILAAVICNDEPPYSMKELEAIGNHITTVEHEVKTERAEHFKRKRDAHVLSKSQEGLPHLDEKEFSRLIKMACSSGDIDKALEEELLKRIEQNQLQPMDFVLILFSIEEQYQDDWLIVQEQLILHLARYPEKAVTILEIAKQIFPEFQMHDCSTESTGEDHALVHTSVVQIHVNDKPYVSLPYSSMQKKMSQQLASVDLIAQIAGVTLPELGETLAPQSQKELKTEKKKPAGNYKGELLETCMKNSWAKPEFRVEKSGPPHAPVFTCVAEMQIEDEMYQSETVEGVSKKDAEQFAAKSLMEKLPQPRFEKKKAVDLNVKGANYLMQLNVFCQKNDFEMPVFTEIREEESGKPSFRVTCTLEALDRTFTGEITAPNKKKGRRKAAEQVWQQVTEYLKDTD